MNTGGLINTKELQEAPSQTDAELQKATTPSQSISKPDYAILEAQLDAIKSEVKGKIGAEDAAYIRRIILIQRICEWSGRILLMLGFLQPVLWVAGVLSLAAAKILDNMEIGHNVMHGQYDWMNDSYINSKR